MTKKREKVSIYEFVDRYMKLSQHELELIKFNGWEHIEQGMFKKVIPKRQTWIPIKSLINK